MLSQADLSTGAYELGTLISSVLYGILLMHLYAYGQKGREARDPTWIRGLVLVVWLLESLHTILIWMNLYTKTITNLQVGLPPVSTAVHWTLPMTLMVQGFTNASIQGFFSYRVFLVSDRVFLAVPSWLLSFVRAGASLLIGIEGLRYREFQQFKDHVGWALVAVVLSSAVVDAWNTLIICWFLMSSRNGFFQRTSRLVKRIMLFSLETGLATLIVAIISVTLFLTRNNTGSLWFALFIVYTKLYSIAFVFSLNSRESLREEPTTGVLSTHICFERSPTVGEYDSDVETISKRLDLQYAAIRKPEGVMPKSSSTQW